MSENHVLPFQIDQTNFRGRFVRLGSTLDDILSLHQYHPVIAKLLGEAISLTACLSATLKFDGVLSLQARGEGILKILVVDVTSDGHIRGYAQYDEDAMAAVTETLSYKELLGTGYLALTIDQGPQMQRYQGMVELVGTNLSEALQHYFKQSEQLETAFKISCSFNEENQKWHAGAIMLQKMPEEGGKQQNLGNADEDSWRRAMVLLSSATDEELTSPILSSKDLLFRLFHEDGVRASEELELIRQCRCSKERIVAVIQSLPDDDLTEIIKDDSVEVKCQFCSTEYKFSLEEINEIRAHQKAKQGSSK